MSISSHPINLLVRFFLEIAGLLALSAWGWNQVEDWLRWLLAIGFPLLAAVIWGVFAVPHDPSRSGKAPIPVPGALRLLIELTFFGLATLALFAIGSNGLGWAMGIVTLLHYAVSYDRILWLLRR